VTVPGLSGPLGSIGENEPVEIDLTADIPQPEDQFFLPGYVRAWLTFLQLLRTPAWEETAVVAVLWLEVQHPVRPWHTAALGAGLLAPLLRSER